MNCKRKNIYRYLYAAAAGLILLGISLMPFSAMKVHAEQERIYQSISDTLRFGEKEIIGRLSDSEITNVVLRSRQEARWPQLRFSIGRV